MVLYFYYAETYGDTYGGESALIRKVNGTVEAFKKVETIKEFLECEKDIEKQLRLSKDETLVIVTFNRF